MSIDKERNQPVSNRCEAEVRDRNAGLEWTSPPRVKERVDIRLYVLAWISQAWSGPVRKLPSHGLCIHLFNNNNSEEIPAVDQFQNIYLAQKCIPSSTQWYECELFL